MNMKAYPVTSSLSNNTLTMSSPHFTKSKLWEQLPPLTEPDLMSDSTNACKVAEEFDASAKIESASIFQNIQIDIY